MRTIWLASYPKSGNTWFRMLLANLTAADDRPVDINALPAHLRIASARGPFDLLLLIDSGLLTHDEVDCLRPRLYEEIARGDHEDGACAPVRFIKAHDAYMLTRDGDALLAGARGADGAIVIIRDPRDIAPSLANHLGVAIEESIAFMNDAQSGFCKGVNRQHAQLRQRLLDWSGHVASWLEQRDIPVHVVRYEDLAADTTATLAQALDFAGDRAGDEAIRRAVRFSGFERLQRQEREKGFREAARPERAGATFFRRGAVGGWRDELTMEQAARIEAAHAPMMRRLGYQLATLPQPAGVVRGEAA